MGKDIFRRYGNVLEAKGLKQLNCAKYKKGTDDSNGIFKIKFVGRVKHSMEIVCRALFEYRKVWDKVIDQVIEIDTLDNKDKTKVVHIMTRSPFPLAVAHRDFVHARTTRNEKEGRIVLDISTVHPKCPEKPGYVRFVFPLQK